MKFLLKTFLITFTLMQAVQAGRYYNTEQGRFIQRDPLGYVDGMSLYNAYFAERFALDPSGTTAAGASSFANMLTDGAGKVCCPSKMKLVYLIANAPKKPGRSTLAADNGHALICLEGLGCYGLYPKGLKNEARGRTLVNNGVPRRPTTGSNPIFKGSVVWGERYNKFLVFKLCPETYELLLKKMMQDIGKTVKYTSYMNCMSWAISVLDSGKIKHQIKTYTVPRDVPYSVIPKEMKPHIEHHGIKIDGKIQQPPWKDGQKYIPKGTELPSEPYDINSSPYVRP